MKLELAILAISTYENIRAGRRFHLAIVDSDKPCGYGFCKNISGNKVTTHVRQMKTGRASWRRHVREEIFETPVNLRGRLIH